ncbi:MAG: spore coat U domain-containing protein [Burkholderiales bacterium]|jgi:spore coat protein U-like protein|nr:spore coat U domain-containing protein [Burkholderiales bacterium]
MKNGKFRSTFSRVAPIAAATLLALGAATAHAATTTGNLTVQASVAKNCLVNSPTLNFGTYNPGSGAVTQNATISVRCTKNTGFTVALNGGQAANINARKMKSTSTPAETLEYQLYTNAGLTTVFGDGTTGSTGAGTGAGMGVINAVNLTVYGQLPDSAANQSAAVLTDYTDSVTITVTY